MDDREIIAEFVTESREHLADVENQLLAIEAAGADLDLELVNTVFRAVHSIKGAAGFLGFSSVGQLAHGLENVLNLVRNRQLAPSSNVTDVLLRSADKLRAMIDDIDHSNGVEISGYLDALQGIVAGLLAEEITGPSAMPIAVPPSGAIPPAGDGRATEAAADGTDCLHSAPGADAQAGEARPAEAGRSLAAAGLSSAAPAGLAAQEGAESGGTSAAAPAAHVESSIRVPVNVLDRLMTLAGELVLARNQLLQTATTGDRASWTLVAGRVNQVTSELQETIMQTRLQPVGTLFGRFPRVIRDLSNALAKQCQLTLEGQEVELDKSIIEAMGDPLTHLVRNAVDHGIESPEVRRKAGKPAAGIVALRAFHQAGKVSIEISDDGRGIDAARLREKATALGILSPEEARGMGDREALMLIFRPGFSTAERVTEVSGRGVGMDVVKTNIERLGGTVTIDTQLGVGTTIHVKLPLTLAIIPALVVQSRGRRYAIPQASIRELVRIKASDVAQRIERVKQAEVFRLRGTLLPLVRLSAALSPEAGSLAERERAAHIIVVESAHLRYGLVVDALCDSEEIVVKPLGRHMKGNTRLAGATILGDGRVAMILDIAGIAQHARLAAPEDDATGETCQQGHAEEMQSLLLFRNHPAEQFGIPMALVARLERVSAASIDSVGGKQILQYRGGTLPLLSLEQYVGCKPRTDASKLYVVVFLAAGREAGLVVPELIDIRTLPTQVDTVTFREPGISGSLVHERMVVRLVDLHELARKAYPDWYESQPLPPRPADRPLRILVVEDSDFFRKQLIGFFQDAGYDVQGCEDGAVAWNALHQPGSEFDLVVTDIEMPNMNGLQLVQRIRSDPRWANLPVVAVTSLAGEDDIERGRQAGVTEYHVKLDREQLTSAVARLLTSPARASTRSVS